ncbi:hypothetical protein H8959_022374, partial [Pygathrix nigripes]
TEEDLEFYVRKCGDILGVTSKLPKDQQDAKHILEHVFFQVVEFKKLNQASILSHTQTLVHGLFRVANQGRVLGKGRPLQGQNLGALAQSWEISS